MRVQLCFHCARLLSTQTPLVFSDEEAAGFPLVFITLGRILITIAKRKPGETTLIIGIGGGVAGASLQVARKIAAQTWF